METLFARIDAWQAAARERRGERAPALIEHDRQIADRAVVKACLQEIEKEDARWRAQGLTVR
jgi:hypothetical protein